MSGADIIEEVLRHLLSGDREELNKLAGGIDASTNQVPVLYDPDGIRPGARIDIGMESMRVWSVESKIATVERGMDGSAASAHSVNDLVSVNPRLSRFAILKAVNDELSALCTPTNGLYTMDTVEFDFNASQLDYEIPSTDDLIEVHSIRERSIAFPDTWRCLDNWTWRALYDTDTFVSGASVHVPYATPGARIQVLYKRRFLPIEDVSVDLETETRMPVRMHDILAMGALIRLGPIREIKRNFTEAQSGARRAEEVPAGSVVNSYRYVESKRKERIDQEAQRLVMLYDS